jgi:hypothetical protein
MKSASLSGTKVLGEIEKKFSRTIDGKRVARTAGVLFIVATLASILSTAFLSPINSSNYLTDVSANGNSIVTGIFLVVISAATSATIAVSMYPVLRKYYPRLALGAVGLRLVEGALYVVGAVGLASLLTVSQQFVREGATQSSSLQTSGLSLLGQYHWASFGAAPLFFGMGALMYYIIFYQTKLVPRCLSDWGIVGAVLCIVASSLVMVSFVGASSVVQVVLILPIAVQEMALAAWLIVKGFRNVSGCGLN